MNRDVRTFLLVVGSGLAIFALFATQGEKATKSFIGVLIFAAAIFLYFLPAIIGRHKKNASAILILNLFLGWTFIGWVIALVWASTKD